MDSPHTSVLDQLLAHITSSLDVIKKLYIKDGGIVPSLDSTDAHPFDDQQPRELRMAIRVLEGACEQLLTTAANPYYTMIIRSTASYELACLRVVTDAKVSDHLKASGSEGIQLPEISAKSGIEVGKLGRILRFLATRHVFREVSKDVFANNRLSILLESENTLSSTVSFFTDECMLASHSLSDTLSDPSFGHSYAPEKAAFTKAYAIEEGKSVWSWYNEKELNRGVRFGRAMIGCGKATTGLLAAAYPWSALLPGSIMNDLGGGLGNISMELAHAYPHLRFIVQDLPSTIDKGRRIWEEECVDGKQQRRIDFVPINFFTETPVVGCDIYYLRHIIHNWPDEDSIQILRNIRRAMKPSSKILIQEYILQQVNRVDDQDAVRIQAPEPLLPNYGSGGMRQYTVDMAMMVIMNARERTLDEFVKLGEQAELKFLNLYDTGEMGIVEYGIA